MAQQTGTTYKTFEAGADLSSSRFRIVKLGGDNVVEAATGTSDVNIGVVTDFIDGTLGNSVTVAIGGTVMVEAGGSISRGARVGGGTGGKATARTSDTHNYVGIALEEATGDGQIIEVLLTPGQQVTA